MVRTVVKQLKLAGTCSVFLKKRSTREQRVIRVPIKVRKLDCSNRNVAGR